MLSRERRRCGRRNGPIGCTSVLNDEGMTVFGNIHDTKVPGSLSEVSRELTQANENDRRAGKRLLKNTFERMNLSENQTVFVTFTVAVEWVCKTLSKFLDFVSD